jgi:nucleotide sugar dehydrogenase
MKIAVIGSEGFVGRACVHIFKDKAEVIKIDPLLGTSVADLDPNDLDVALICVPTPMGNDGVINASIVEKVIEQLSGFKNTLVVLKSTVLPDIVDRLAQGNPNFIYNPEFLTERNAEHDAEYPIMTVLGGETEAVERMALIYKNFTICKDAPYYFMSPKEASFVKYGINSFLATKVMFWNQFNEQCEKMGANYDIIKTAIGTDARIGFSHMDVPGHDGRKGFGGSCFSKDIPAFIHFSNMELSVIREVWNANCDIRNQYNSILEREKSQDIKLLKI